jgi:hypothetical protein
MFCTYYRLDQFAFVVMWCVYPFEIPSDPRLVTTHQLQSTFNRSRHQYTICMPG